MRTHSLSTRGMRRAPTHAHGSIRMSALEENLHIAEVQDPAGEGTLLKTPGAGGEDVGVVRLVTGVDCVSWVVDQGVGVGEDLVSDTAGVFLEEGVWFGRWNGEGRGTGGEQATGTVGRPGCGDDERCVGVDGGLKRRRSDGLVERGRKEGTMREASLSQSSLSSWIMHKLSIQRYRKPSALVTSTACANVLGSEGSPRMCLSRLSLVVMTRGTRGSFGPQEWLRAQ